MKTKTMVTVGLMMASLTVSSAWADNTSPTVASEPISSPPIYAEMPNCTTEERMKELAEENSFAQNNIREAKDMGANVLGAALSIFAGVDIPVGEARDAYNHARSAKQTYEVFTPCTSEQELEMKKIKSQAAQALEREVKNSSTTSPPQPEESTAEKTGKFLRTLPF
jgi:hypothetical protein